MQIFRAYPEEEVRAGGNFIFEIDAEGRIAAIVRIGDFMKNFGVGYYRAHYDPLHDENSSIVFQHRENNYKPGASPPVMDSVRIPEGGFVFILSDALFVAKKILQFIIPEEYQAFLDPESHRDYAGRNGQQLFSNVLKRNELDAITVELTGSSLIFRKPVDTVDPMAVNIEALAKIVRRELERKHDQQIEAMTSRLEEVADMADDNESNINDLESRIDDLESALEALRSQLEELQEDEEE